MVKQPTHLDHKGRARMVDVSAKPVTAREAVAQGRVRMSGDAYAAVRTGDNAKGDVRAAAEIAGVMAGKRTSDLIPLCHPLPLSSLIVDVSPDDANFCYVVTARARTSAQTGVEMEALTAVSVACLTIYDMTKALDRTIVIEDIKLLTKSGGASGDFQRDDA